jgi:hypothetical protein
VDRIATVLLLLIGGAFLVNVLQGHGGQWLKVKFTGRA